MTIQFDDATLAQVNASCPTSSTWVTANAGSGKTRVLTDRVARLLLHNTLPQRILCLTYTKAAATEMQTRLFERLGSWSMMQNAELKAALKELGEDPTTLTSERLQSARTLFAMALETPGGLKIQTIHSFCDAILRQFPIEASVSPQFVVMSDHQSRSLQSQALDQVAVDNAGIFHRLALEFSGSELDELISEITKNRSLFENRPSRSDFGLSESINLDMLWDAVFNDVMHQTLLALYHYLLTLNLGKTDQALLSDLQSYLKSENKAQKFNILQSRFLNGKNTKVPFSAKTDTIPTKKLLEDNLNLRAEVNELMARVEEASSSVRSLQAFHRSEILYIFAREFLNAYQALKFTQGYLDYDDLIAKASNLLSNSSMAQWVLYRLDGGIDHILVDEAQDTSPVQWKVVERLHREFTVGDSANQNERTLFVVGDEKQSIYSFQGADPAAFEQMKEHFSERLLSANQELESSDLVYSFRSASPILALADSVLSIAASEQFPNQLEHIPFFNKKPGRVDVWPFMEPPEKPKSLEWYKPVNQPSPNDPIFDLANKIAQKISYLLDSSHPIPICSDATETRPVRPSDFLILVQRRSKLFHPIIRALKSLEIPIAGADVLKVSDELAVRDILSLLKFATTPDDDLSLAEALRSPILGLSEQDLFHLAHGRKGFLWQELRSKSERFQAAHEILSDVLQNAEFLRPFELIDQILTKHGARKRFLARLGYEAEDGIDEMLSLALQFEQEEPPTLTGFISWFDANQASVKRQTDTNTDQVRVMTVHGAKGLESPIVILPETQNLQSGRSNSLLVIDNKIVTWPSSSEQLSNAQLDAQKLRKELADRENKRLLYVALTRAENWLIVAGAGKQSKEQKEWYGIIESAMKASGATIVGEGDNGNILCLQNEEWEQMVSPQGSEESHIHGITAPNWLLKPAQKLPRPLQTIAPSHLSGPKSLEGEGLDADTARARGSLIHLFLEHLDGSEDQSEFAHRLFVPLRNANPDLDFDEAYAEALKILRAKELSFLFDSSALAEVEVSAEIPELGNRTIQGSIDRLIVEADKITIVDFKSNSIVPKTNKETPVGILAQLGAYLRAIEQIYPKRRIEIKILWTRTASLMSIPHDIVIEALQTTQHLDPVQKAT